MPDICTVTGTLYDTEGVEKPRAKITVTPISVTGILLHSDEEDYRSDDNGVVTFDVIQGARYNVRGRVLGFTRTGQDLTIPASGTANLEDLAAVVSVPAEGLTVKDEGTSLSTLVGTFNFVGAGVAVTQPSAGVATVTIAGGGAVTSVFGRTGAVVAVADDYTWAQINKATSSLADITTRSASDLSSGTLPDARFPATLPAISGANLTNLNASAIASGTLDDARLSANIATKAYADALVVGLVDDRGNFDASGNAFPSSGGSGTAGAILKGDLWTISVAGTLGGSAVTAGDLVRALVDTPGQTASNWAITENNIGYVAENQANKATNFSTLNNTLYPTTQAVANYAQPLDADLTAIAALADPNADRILFWDDSLGAYTYLTVGSNLSITDTTLNAAGGGTTINATDTVIPYRSDANTFLDSPLSVASSAVTMARNGIGATTSDGLILSNTTDAAAGAQQWSPRLRWHGEGWKTNAAAASQEVDWIAELVPVQGAANPSANLVFSSQVNAGGYTARFTLYSGGSVSSPGGTQSERYGASATATGAFAVTVGNNGQNGSDNGILIGALSTINAVCDGAVVVGSQSSVSASSGGAIVIGKTAGGGTGTATGANSISIGLGSVAPTANTMVVGGSAQPINVFYGGKGERHATPVLFTLSGTHGLGTDISGADIAIQAGLPTGAGNGGAIIFKGALPGASSSTRQTAEEWARISSTGILTFPSTLTGGGTTGNQTIHKASGSVNFAASATSLVVTNNKVTANSIILAIVMTNDATMKAVQAVPGSGSFTLYADAAPTGETKVGWVVLNQ